MLGGSWSAYVCIVFMLQTSSKLDIKEVPVLNPGTGTIAVGRGGRMIKLAILANGSCMVSTEQNSESSSAGPGGPVARFCPSYHLPPRPPVTALAIEIG